MDIIKNEIYHFIKEHKKLADNIRVVLVANVVGKTEHKEKKSYKNISLEFFTEVELDEIIQGLRKNGLYVECYFDETYFIRDTISGKMGNLTNLLVFNFTRNGFGIGKKSLIPSFCDLMNIKYTGSDAYTTSLARHKYHYSKLLSHVGLHGIPSWLYNQPMGWLQEVPPTGTKLICKPFCESASKGISEQTIMDSSDPSYIEKIKGLNQQYQQSVVCQQFISGYEIEVPVLKLTSTIILPPVGIKIEGNKLLGNKIISEEKSSTYCYDYYLAAEIFPEEVISRLIQIARGVYYMMGIKNYGRVDFRMDTNYNIYVMDISATPYLISHSSFNYIFDYLGFEQKDIFLLIILSALLGQD